MSKSAENLITSIWEQRICHTANIDFDVLNDHVCELHFDYRCKTGNDCALEEGSLPTLHLPTFGTLFYTGNAHFQISTNRIEEPSYTISIDALSYHCRLCLRKGLLYEIETSTYRNKYFSSLIDLSPKLLPNNTQPNACLSCLKSIVISHQLSLTMEHSNTILQQLLQHPKQSKLVSNTNFFDIKSELSFYNLVLANSISIKLEIDTEDNTVNVNEDYEQKWVGTGEPTSSVAFVNTQNMDENCICVTEIQDNDSKINDSVTSEKQCQKGVHKFFAIGGECKTDLSSEGYHDVCQNSDSCVLMENTDFMVSNNSHYSCVEDRQFDNEQAPESTSRAGEESNWQRKASTLTDKNTYWNGNDGTNPSFHTFNVHMGVKSVIVTEELETPKTAPVRNADGRYQCTECPKAFRTKSHFSRHAIIHVNERPYICIECLKTFTLKSSLDIHKRIHTNERPYKCTECPKAFIQKNALCAHEKIHSNERPYKCSECPKAYRYSSVLSVHKRIHTNEKPYKCTECPRTFSQNGHLSQHMRIHTNERPYKCTLCPKTFSLKSNCDVHQRIHINERPYKCPECTKTFITKGNFDKHKGIHMNERPYKCTECPKTFRYKSVLSVHKKTHTNERPYKCVECPKTFSHRNLLVIHKRSHTNERPYKCAECPKAFTTKGSLDIHKRIHTNERPYKCTVCSKSFITKGNLDIHKRKHTCTEQMPENFYYEGSLRYTQHTTH